MAGPLPSLAASFAPILQRQPWFCVAGAGVVDEDYRGEVGVVLFNHADTPFPGGWCGSVHFIQRTGTGLPAAAPAAAAAPSHATRPTLFIYLV